MELLQVLITDIVNTSNIFGLDSLNFQCSDPPLLYQDEVLDPRQVWARLTWVADRGVQTEQTRIQVWARQNRLWSPWPIPVLGRGLHLGMSSIRTSFNNSKTSVLSADSIEASDLKIMSSLMKLKASEKMY